MGTQLKAAINQLDGVIVISGVSVNAYRGANRDIHTIRDNLSVHYIIDCEMAVAGKNVTATVDFINASDSQTVWSETYEDNVDGIFAIKSAIASRIADAIGIKVGTTTAQAIGKASTENTEAFKLYTQGRALWYTRSEAGMRQSLKLYEQAIALDPEFAEAYSGMADSYSMMGVYSYMDVNVSYPKAREFAVESITRNSNLAEAYVALAWIQFAHDWKFKESEKNYRKAIQIDPKFAQAYHWLGINLTSQGRFDEAYLILKKALGLDPVNHVILLNFSVPSIELEKYDEAEAANKKGLSVNPGYYNNLELLYAGYVRRSGRENDIKNLVDEIETYINKNRQIYNILVHYYKDKDDEKFNEYSAKLKSYLNTTKWRYLEQSKILYIGFDAFMEQAEKAYTMKTLMYGFGTVSTYYFLDEHKDNPRYKALVEKFREGR